MYPLLVLAVVVLVLVGVIAIAKEFFGGGEEAEESPYVKKPFVFDHSSELALYRQLVELFGDRYYIFVQVPYSRLIEVKKGEEKRHRNRFDKKIADFVLCDKQRAVAQLVIELDGASHKREKTKERDAFVDRMLASIGLPILHLTPGLSRDALKAAIEGASKVHTDGESQESNHPHQGLEEIGRECLAQEEPLRGPFMNESEAIQWSYGNIVSYAN